LQTAASLPSYFLLYRRTRRRLSADANIRATRGRIVEKTAWRRGPDFSADFQTIGFLFRAGRHRKVTPRMNIGQMRETGLQRRTAVRYKLRLPVIFHWNDGVDHTSGGFTSDVALDGALIVSCDCPPVGSEVRVEVLLPSPEMENEELRIGCSGKVIHALEKSGFSAFGFHGMFQDDQLTRHVLHFDGSR
jgi:PilZ domain-containing protein